MNAFAIMYVNEHLESLRAEARKRSDLAGREAQPSRSDRVAGLRTPPLPGHEAGGSTTLDFVPQLKNYPYRG